MRRCLRGRAEKAMEKTSIWLWFPPLSPPWSSITSFSFSLSFFTFFNDKDIWKSRWAEKIKKEIVQLASLKTTQSIGVTCYCEVHSSAHGKCHDWFKAGTRCAPYVCVWIWQAIRKGQKRGEKKTCNETREVSLFSSPAPTPIPYPLVVCGSSVVT